MKFLLPAFALVASFNSFSSEVDIKTFIYDGSRDSTELVLRAEKFVTRKVTVDSTCEERQIVGHRTVCSGTSYGPRPYYPGPHYPGHYYPGPRRHPGPYSQYCVSEPVYRYDSYPCRKEVDRKVKDTDVEARVIVDVTNLSSQKTTGETLKVILKGDSPSIDATGSKKFFILKKDENVRASTQGVIKHLDVLYAVELIEAAPVLSSLKITDMEVIGPTLKFRISEALGTRNFSLKIVKNRFLASDKLVIEKKLVESEVEINGQEGTIDLSKLGANLADGKFNITLTATPKFDGSLLNVDDFSELSGSNTLTYKTR